VRVKLKNTGKSYRRVTKSAGAEANWRGDISGIQWHSFCVASISVAGIGGSASERAVSSRE
jgi:hypothetical protein